MGSFRSAEQRRGILYARRLALAASGAAVFLAAPAAAQDGTGAQIAEGVKLAPIVVEADKKTDRPKLPAGEAAVLTSETDRSTLDAAQVDDFEDLARRIDAGVSYNAASKSVGIRGLDDNRVLTTVDGVPIPWLDDGSRGVTGGSTAFSFDSLSAIDIVRGADSSVFGSGALGGVVAVRTLDPEDILTDGRRFGGLTRGGYDSSDGQWKVEQTLAGHSGNTWLLLQGGYGEGHETDNMGDVGGLGPTRSKTNPADTTDKNLLFKLHQYADGGHRFGLTAELFDSRNAMDWLSGQGAGENFAAGDYDRTETIKRKRLSASYDYAAPDAASWLNSVHAVVYWQDLELGNYDAGERITAPTGRYVRDSTLEERSLGFNGNLTGEFATGTVSHSLLFAADGALRKTSQGSHGVDNCVSHAFPPCSFLHTNQADMPEVQGGSIGLAVQDTISLADGKFRVIPGLRFDYYRESPQETVAYHGNPAVPGLPAASSGSKLSPKLRLEWDVSPETTLYAQWARGFRAPSATELFLSYGSPESYYVIGNPNLRPETVNGFEIGAKFGNERLGGGINIYDNYYRNFIDHVNIDASDVGIPDNGFPWFFVERYINRSHVRIYGVEADAHWQFAPRWTARASIAYAHGRDTDLDEALNSVPPLKGIFGLGYAAENWGADLSVTLAAARNAVEDPSSDRNKLPGYGVVDLTGWWNPPDNENLKVQAGIFNIFDEKYWSTLEIPESNTKDYYTAPGRSFKVAVNYRF